MGETALVEAQVDDAVALIQKLDETGHGPSLVTWYFYDDADQWRLIIAGPTFDPLLPKQEPVAYRILVEAIASLSLSSLTVSDLKVVNTRAPLPQALRRLLGTGPKGLVRAHFTNTTLDGLFIKDMVILRST